MSEDPYGSLDEPIDQPSTTPQAQPAKPEPAPQPEALGYNYSDANGDYAYGPPAGPQFTQQPYGQQPYAPQAFAQQQYGQQPYGQQQSGAYGVPFYGQPQGQYLPAISPFTQRPLIDDPYAADAPKLGVSPVEAYRRYWTRGLTFTGRASRSEYWWPALINGVGFLLLTFMIGATDGSGISGLFGLILGFGLLAALVPGIAVSTRRLHDTDNSGWLQLINLIPYVGSFVTMILMAQAPKPGGMRYDKVNQR